MSIFLTASLGSQAATFVVTSAADTAGSTCTSTCTLRQAMTAANATTAADTINFNISLPTRGEILISPATALPAITQPLTINGYSQSGTRVNSDTEFNNAKLRIRIDGAAAPVNTKGLTVCANNVTVRGLIITRFDGDGIIVGFSCAAVGAQIRGNYIGLNASGVLAENRNGIDLVDGPTVGGSSPQDQNVIVDTNRAITVRSSGANILGNLINVRPDGQIVSGIGSTSASIGLLNNVSDTSIGVGAINKIGISNVGISYVPDPASLNNSHFSNAFLPAAEAGLAVDFGADGVTPNDPNDVDTGPNGLQNFPVLQSASRVSGGLSVTGRLDVGHPGSLPYGISLYASGACGAGGHGPGERYLGQTTVTVSSVSENFAFTQTTTDTLPVGTVITALATRTGVGSSEFSTCFNLDAAPLVVNVTDDVGDGVCNSSHCSLRDAIIVANNANAPQRIHFAIPGSTSGEIMIQPATLLPQITQAVTIDGYTQAGAAPNTDSMESTATNAVLRIRLDGDNRLTTGLEMCGGNSIVRGLSITRFTVGIRGCAGLAYAVEGSFIGLASDGLTAAGNSTGIIVANLPGRVGGPTPAQRNLIASNIGGVTLFGNAAGTRVLGNLFGKDKTGVQDRANSSSVFLNEAVNNSLIGEASAPNRIRGGTFGISLNSTVGLGNTLAINSFVDQTTAAIDLGSDGVTPNDPDDNDSGPNELLNFPELDLAERNATGLRVVGTISRQPGALSIYASRSCHASGHGGGEHLLGTVLAPISFDLQINTNVDLSEFPVITAVTTFANSTSEFSACITATDQPAGITVDSAADTTPDGGCTQSGDSNTCTLREAILLANTQAGSDVIRFGISGDGPHIIQPLTNLPVITGGLTIDGYSEFGAVANAAEVGSDAVLKIDLQGSSVSHVLRTCTSEAVELRGLALSGGSLGLISTQLDDTASCSALGSLRVRGCWLGLDASGDARSTQIGITNNHTRLTLGGAELADRNVIANSSVGVRIAGTGSNASIVQNNLFGLNPELGGGSSVDNSRDLDLVNVSGVVVGGDAGLVNSFNQSQTAILVAGTNSDGNTLYANHFANHSFATAIDLSDTGAVNGININDPNDSDTGANEGQNTPVLTDGTADPTNTVINGTLDVPAGITTPSIYRLAIYRSATCNDTSPGREGEQYLGSVLQGFTSNAENFSITLARPPLSGFITMTVTSPDGSTSEFSNCLVAPQPQLLFRNGFEG